jgi:hypothetical protein
MHGVSGSLYFEADILFLKFTNFWRQHPTTDLMLMRTTTNLPYTNLVFVL